MGWGIEMLIALVEPSRTTRRIVTEMIGPEHQVFALSDGDQALELLCTNPDIRALITTAELPSISGIQLCAQARALAGSKRPLYIILMSSSEERHKRVEALENGADDFISKPPYPEELRARLHAAERLTSMQVELIRLATVDALTGLLTRRAFFEKVALPQLTSQPVKAQTLSVLVCDLDHFKTINDTYGHDAGDVVLQVVGMLANATGASVGRFGGEEFVFLLETPLDEAAEFAERFRETLSRQDIEHRGKTLRITCSIGVAEWGGGESIELLLRRADTAMYEAKQSGRNRVVVAPADSAPA